MLPRELYDTAKLKSTEKSVKFESYGNCFVCGENNPGGLRLQFKIDRERKTLKTAFTPGSVFQGYDGVVHGGILSTLLDEATAKLAYELGHLVVTASLEIRFKKAAPIGKRLLAFGEITEMTPRLIRARSELTLEDGTVVATATSTLMRVKNQ
jgi:uncharacterized protein (TIGR00369 family)